MRKTRAMMFGLLLCMLGSAPAYAVTEGTWTADGKMFQKADGSIAKNEWIEGENGSYFYVGEDGRYVTGWQTIRERGSDAVHEYYFNPADGAMFYENYTPDGYWVNMDGVKTENRSGIGDLPAEPAGQSTETEADAPAEQTTESSQQTEESAPAPAEEAEETAGQAADTAEDGGSYSEANANTLIALLNQRRRQAGKGDLPVDADLSAAAAIRAKEIAGYADDSSIYLRPEAHYLAEAAGSGNEMTTSSVTAVSAEARAAFTNGRSIMITESAAWGVSNPREAVEDWFAKNSDGNDKSNKTFILDTKDNGFNAIGASCFIKDGKQYYSVFIGVRK
ncbi:MAG: hypothetical protein Q4C63_05620 [Eubacteriales bacterium]|nr:hypothetical protein [Eubacteriales bacterium]